MRKTMLMIAVALIIILGFWATIPAALILAVPATGIYIIYLIIRLLKAKIKEIETNEP